MNDTVDDTASAESPAPLPPPLAPPPSTPAPAVTPARSGNAVGGLALLLADGALGAVGFASYRDSTQRQLDEFRLQSSLQEQVVALNELQRQLNSQRNAARSSREQLQSGLDGLRADLLQQRQQLDELQRVDRSSWQLAEAEYLLQIAAQRLVLGGDPESALRMLQQADDILRDIDDGALLPVRAALADDIAALKAVPVIDIEGIYVAIDATARRAQQLQLIRPTTVVAPTESAAPAADPQASWGERLQSGIGAAVAKLAQLVQVRRRDEPYRALLAPEHEAALRHNLQLLFEQAQLALLAGNQTLYERSLDKCRDWLLTYFTLDESNAHALAASVDELRQRQVAASPIDIGHSRRLLKRYLEQRLRVAPMSASTPTSQPPAGAAAEAQP